MAKLNQKRRCMLCDKLQDIEDLADVEGYLFCKDSPYPDVKSCEAQQCDYIQWNNTRERPY